MALKWQRPKRDVPDPGEAANPGVWDLNLSKPDVGPRPSVYLTDKRSLFRVVARRVMEDEILVELEDCLTLDTWLVTQREVTRLRPVRSAETLAAR